MDEIIIQTEDLPSDPNSWHGRSSPGRAKSLAKSGLRNSNPADNVHGPHSGRNRDTVARNHLTYVPSANPIVGKPDLGPRSAAASEPPIAPSFSSPDVPHQSIAQAPSDAGSLNVRLDRSHLSERTGNYSTTQTHRSTTSQKRTTDQMHGADLASNSDSRPTKQLLRSPQSLRPDSPIQSHPQSRRVTTNDPPSPSLLTHPVPAYYRNSTSTARGVHKQTKTSPPSSPSYDTAPESQQLKQPATRPITEPQLVNEVKGIYAGLVMVERKCVDIINQQNALNKRLSDQQWKALVALHRTLLQEHHDFFSASQHPTASDALKKLATKYAMPARMWRHGIHAFLELLRHRLPESMEHMLSFIYLAYSMMALLKESVPSFVETWIECLGDLARYRMAIEDTDPRDREIWSNVAKMWYNEAADKSPKVGRIQHHLAVLARPNIVEQLFYYDKALVSVVPFLNARESIMLLFDMFLKNNEAVQSRYPPAEYAFVYFYALLFTRHSIPECRRMLELLGSSIGSYIDRAGPRFKIQGPQMAASLFSGLLDFGRETESHLWELYVAQSQDREKQPTSPTSQSATKELSYAEKWLRQKQYWATMTTETPVTRIAYAAHMLDQEKLNTSADVVALAALMTKETIFRVSSRMGDKNIVPFMHVVLANLFDMSFVAGALVYIEGCVPWASIALFLNTLIGRSGVTNENFESDDFPLSYGGHGRQLPEDFVMRGMMTTNHYYKPEFFAPPLVDDDERSIELPSHQTPRAERCLWLGVRLAKLGRYLAYDSDKRQFEATAFAGSLATLYV